MAKPKEISSLSYDQALEELETIVQQLEAEVGDLDAALALYERGQALSLHCSKLLEQAELRVQQLGSDGQLTALE
ncbi:MAG: exodeoxyribonuclease VII small subunit [Anaerolineales bacterium]|nr:exodeoxyribonuclease VII small subunit [Anaerolineales bacterium]